MRFFKYGKKQHLTGLLGMGTLRIGTLSDYRRGEHAMGISDATEGTKELINLVEKLNITGSDWGDGERKSAEMLAQFGVLRAQPGSNVYMDNVMIVKNFAIDAYAFCFAIEEKPSIKTMRQFEGADSCVEIVAPDDFFKCLQTTVVQGTGAHRVIAARPVEYKDRIECYNGGDFGLHPGLIKEYGFRSQNEGRILWEFESGVQRYEPFLSGHWKLGSYCREMKLDSIDTCNSPRCRWQ